MFQKVESFGRLYRSVRIARTLRNRAGDVSMAVEVMWILGLFGLLPSVGLLTLLAVVYADYLLQGVCRTLIDATADHPVMRAAVQARVAGAKAMIRALKREAEVCRSTFRKVQLAPFIPMLTVFGCIVLMGQVQQGRAVAVFMLAALVFSVVLALRIICRCLRMRRKWARLVARSTRRFLAT